MEKPKDRLARSLNTSPRWLLSGNGRIGRGLVGLLHRGFSGLEAHLGMRAVAERLVHRPAAAAERERHFAGEVVGIAVGVHQFDAVFGRLHAVRPVLAARDLYLRHLSPPDLLLGAKHR